MVFPWDVCYVVQFHWLQRDLFEIFNLYGVLSLASTGYEVYTNGWFFAIFEHCSTRVYNNMQTISESETSETVWQDSNLLVDTSMVDIPYTIFDTSTCAFSVTKSCAVSFYAICFSVLKPCSFWNSDTLDAIVESVMLNDTIEYWISSSELPQNININGANIAVTFISSERETLVCSWPSSKLALERFILEQASLNTGFFLHFPNLCLGCVCHNRRRTKYFLISCNEELVLRIYRTDDAKSLVQTVCEIVTNKLSSDTTVYCIKFIACTCQISEGKKRKILRC